jgi:hypothetical protein
MFNNPDAFYRTEGEDAIHAAPVARKNLEQFRDNLLDGLANDYQRKRLGAALDAQIQLTRQQMARHVAEQSLVWQRQVALDRIDLLAKEAALHHSDDGLIDVLGTSAANAARAHARVGVDSPDTEIEDRAAVSARSRVLAAGMQARPESAYSECIAECSQKFANGELLRPRWFTGSDSRSLMRICIRACLAEKGDLNYLLPSPKENEDGS